MNGRKEEVALKIRQQLMKAVLYEPAEGVLFSGGLDSAILACINPAMKAITITLESHGLDIEYARNISGSKGIPLYHRKIGIEEAMSKIPIVIRMLESFDPALPNDLAVYFGLEYAKELGLKSIMTGDGSDEIFAGYSFMETLDDLEGYINNISPFLKFSSNRVGNHLGLAVKQPFLEASFFRFALSIDTAFKIKRTENKTWGKWILRYAFTDLIPNGHAWQTKRPLEEGSGMSYLRDIITSQISDKEFAEKKTRYGIQFLNKEHLYYYEIFRKEVGEIPPVREGEKQCKGCGAGMKKETFHCRVCGSMEDRL
jgi:asparagine synthase (glutamine-hydrolysing)